MKYSVLKTKDLYISCNLFIKVSEVVLNEISAILNRMLYLIEKKPFLGHISFFKKMVNIIPRLFYF